MGQITLDEYARASSHPIPDKYLESIKDLLRRVGAVRLLYDAPMIVSSGYRDPAHNLAVGGAKNSKHLTGQAVDILDPTKHLATWVKSNLDTLAQLDLWVEALDHTPGWVHFQNQAPKSGKRIFNP